MLELYSLQPLQTKTNIKAARVIWHLTHSTVPLQMSAQVTALLAATCLSQAQGIYHNSLTTLHTPCLVSHSLRRSSLSCRHLKTLLAVVMKKQHSSSRPHQSRAGWQRPCTQGSSSCASHRCSTVVVRHCNRHHQQQQPQWKQVGHRYQQQRERHRFLS